MQKEFIPYEQALALKELGFDEICPTKYGMTSLKLYENWKPYRNSDDIYEGKFFCNDLCAAPLYQQAFRWFREKYGFEIFLQKEVNLLSGKTYSYLIENDVEEIIKRSLSKSGIERAELECLKALIETVKEKQL